MDDEKDDRTAIEIIATPLRLKCGLTLPNRLVKCPMQETCASPPMFDPPVERWRNIYDTWSKAQYGMLLTGQVQIDLRFLSVAGDVAVHEGSTSPEVMAKWTEWATIAQRHGTPCIVQLAHPGRMSPAGAGSRPRDMPALCPSSVPVKMGDTWLDKLAMDAVLGTPKAMTVDEIDEAVANFKRGAVVARDAGFAGIQIHAAHGFLVSQFLSPHTNRRTDEYGGTAEKRLRFLQRLVVEIREMCPAPFCVGVKLNSGDYMGENVGLSTDEGLGQVKWLIECGQVDFVEISGGNAEQTSSKLHGSFGDKSMDKAPRLPSFSSSRNQQDENDSNSNKKESTRLREAYFTDFAERVQHLQSDRPPSHRIPIQLSGGFRSRAGMADAIRSQVCDLVGLGRTAVLEPSLPRDTLLNAAIPDESALGMSHQIRGLWLGDWIPAKVVGSGLGIQFFYYNMRRLGDGLDSLPDVSVPWVVVLNLRDAIRDFFLSFLSRSVRT